MKYYLVDYKGKWHILQDKVDEDDWSDGTIDEEKLTDDYLENHVFECNYYGIPPYIGDNKELRARIDQINTIGYERLRRNA